MISTTYSPNRNDMIKLTCMILLLALVSCARQSSPDGRAQLRDEQLQSQLDSLKHQNGALLDSIRIINNQLKAKR